MLQRRFPADKDDYGSNINIASFAPPPPPAVGAAATGTEESYNTILIRLLWEPAGVARASGRVPTGKLANNLSGEGGAQRRKGERL